MSIIESVAKSISRKIANKLDYDSDREEVIYYGAFALLHTACSIGLVLLAGYICGIFIEVATLSCVAALLRKFSGGAHCTSPGRCTLAGVINFLALGFIVKTAALYIYGAWYFIYLAVCFAASAAILARYCPVDSPNKPIRLEETKKRLRKGAFLFLLLSLVAVAAAEILFKIQKPDCRTVSLSIATGILWQSFTLLPAGHRLINWYDRALMHIIK